ncbi:MAG: hypothetical protein ACLFUB_05505 [Cyclobacteriaceae bacterium]
MKTERTGIQYYQDKGSISRSYLDGWAKALENFDKYVRDIRSKRSYRLHKN